MYVYIHIHIWQLSFCGSGLFGVRSSLLRSCSLPPRSIFSSVFVSDSLKDQKVFETSHLSQMLRVSSDEYDVSELNQDSSFST